MDVPSRLPRSRSESWPAACTAACPERRARPGGGHRDGDAPLVVPRCAGRHRPARPASRPAEDLPGQRTCGGTAAAELDSRRAGCGPWVRLDGIKFYADGWLVPRTCAMCRSFEDEDSDGILFTDATTLARRIEPFAARGWRIATHAIGDRAVEARARRLRAGLGDTIRWPSRPPGPGSSMAVSCRPGSPSGSPGSACTCASSPRSP